MKRQVQQVKKAFCTECGSDLDDFCLAPGGVEYAEILKNHFECQRTGKFKGSMCAKLYIADGRIPEPAKRKSSSSTKKVAGLKASVMQKIKAEQEKRK
jgi:hypothetical protein